MSIRQMLTEDMKQAMKAKEAEKLSVIRMALAKFKEADIECRAKGKEAADENELISVLTKMVKQRKESAKTYSENNRPDAATKELNEVSIIEHYLPKALSEQEIEQAIQKAISEVDAKELNDTGKVVSKLKEDYTGRIDFGKIVPQIRKMLGA